jgi:hypothetical protein
VFYVLTISIIAFVISPSEGFSQFTEGAVYYQHQEVNVDEHSEAKQGMLALQSLPFITASRFSLTAQNTNVQYVYKFSVDEIKTRQDAKYLMYDLKGQANILSVDFIEDCRCFKLMSEQSYTYAELNDLVRGSGFNLAQRVLCGDGSTLFQDTEVPPVMHTE